MKINMTIPLAGPVDDRAMTRLRFVLELPSGSTYNFQSLTHDDPTRPVLRSELNLFELLLLHAKKVLVITTCLSVAVVLGCRWIAGPPKKAQLFKVEGVVESVRIVKRTDTATHPLVRIRGRPEAFIYLDWFPDPQVINDEVKPGDLVRLLSDIPGNHWIWELEKNGRRIVKYEQVLAAVRSNNLADKYIALTFGSIGLALLVSYARSVRKRD